MPPHASETTRRLSQDTKTKARSQGVEQRCAGQSRREETALSSVVFHSSLEVIGKRRKDVSLHIVKHMHTRQDSSS
ncbi:hypothetical protein WJX82_005912 [Trebouxia sp. C0006]